MATRNNPYGAFNFIVELGALGGADEIAGGFSDVTGLSGDIVYAEYRNGNDKENRVRKIPTLYKTGDVTLKRGLIGDTRLFDWFERTRTGSYDPQTVRITLLDEARIAVCEWTLYGAQPKTWIGPTLAARTPGEVAMEELVLVAEGIEFRSRLTEVGQFTAAATAPKARTVA